MSLFHNREWERARLGLATAAELEARKTGLVPTPIALSPPSPWRSRVAAGAMGLMVFGTFTGVTKLYDDTKAGPAREMTQQLANNRNTCTTGEAHLAGEVGKQSLSLTVNIQQGQRPESQDQAFDSLWANRTFTDGPSGLGVLNTTRGTWVALGESGDTQASQNHIDIDPAKLGFQAGDALSVYHMNTVNYQADGFFGPLGDDSGTAVGTQFCGRITLNSQPSS